MKQTYYPRFLNQSYSTMNVLSLPLPLPLPEDDGTLHIQTIVDNLKTNGHFPPAHSQNRDTKFIYAFRVCLYQMMYLHFATTATSSPVDEWVWHITNTTENMRTQVHTYRFSIPHYYNVGEITHATRTAQGERVEPGPIQIRQSLPDPGTLQTRMETFFKDYRFYDPVQDITSKTEIFCVEDRGADIQGMVRVVYVNKHYPYYVNPSSISPLEQMTKRYTSLKRSYNNLNDKHARQTAVLHSTIHIYKEAEQEKIELQKQMLKMHARVETLFGKMYANSMGGIPIDEMCPVCLDMIEPGQLRIASYCCHFICSSCVERCTMCPICRHHRPPVNI